MLVLLDEDAQALDDRRADWAASLFPPGPPNSGSLMTPSNTRGSATAQIARKAEAHRVRTEINDSLAADRMAFDESPEAERLRRFDLACRRGLARSLDSLLKLRRAPELVDCLSPVLAGSLSAASDALESNAPPIATSEPAVDAEYTTNGSVRAGTGWEEARQDPCPQESGTGYHEARQEPRRPENGSSPRAISQPIRNDGDDTAFDDESDRQRTAEWIRATLARIVALQAEKPRELNE